MAGSVALRLGREVVLAGTFGCFEIAVGAVYSSSYLRGALVDLPDRRMPVDIGMELINGSMARSALTALDMFR